MAKKKKTPKLICKTPWLKILGFGGDWGFRDNSWLCRPDLAKLFSIPNGTRRIRVYLYDSKPMGSDSWRVELRKNKLCWCSIRYCSSVSWRIDKPWGELQSQSGRFLYRHLFNGYEIGGIKKVWIEVEIED